MFKITGRKWIYLRAKVITAINVADLREGSLRASPAISKSFKQGKILLNTFNQQHTFTLNKI